MTANTQAFESLLADAVAECSLDPSGLVVLPDPLNAEINSLPIQQAIDLFSRLNQHPDFVRKCHAAGIDPRTHKPYQAAPAYAHRRADRIRRHQRGDLAGWLLFALFLVLVAVTALMKWHLYPELRP
jgi:hypothetical protein